ncbi:MAG: DUF1564 family protein, partial [Leptospiraceae bacterium]|nr:DUF1564 family protein [Leptospiraceae bacterium]
MKYKFILNETTQMLNLKSQKRTVSTVWIPLWLDFAVKKGIARYGNMEKYLGILLKRYRFLFYTNYIKPSENAKTEYQKRGEDYVIRKFRPELRDWLELGMWADALGFSKAFMFVKLVEIDERNEFFVDKKVFRRISYVVTTS